jgi:predicted small integral membrane protein
LLQNDAPPLLRLERQVARAMAKRVLTCPRKLQRSTTPADPELNSPATRNIPRAARPGAARSHPVTHRSTPMTVRLAKILLTLTLAAFAGLVTFNNLTDYGSNYLFVQHVLSMDTTFPHSALRYRATSNPLWWQLAYWLIIASEGVTCVLLALGALKLWGARRASGAAFNRAKAWVSAGCAAGFMLWFCGFMVIGGEWFAMWQSEIWNGQEGAFRFYMAILGVLIFVNQRDDDLLPA